MKVLTAAEMREVDRLTTERYGIAGTELMESAARRTVESIQNEFGPLNGRLVLIVCGRGNNGGDGAAIARLIHTDGAVVEVILLGRVEETSADARQNFDKARSIAEHDPDTFAFREAATSGDLRQATDQRRFDLIVDAILGTGVSRPAEGLFADAIQLINERSGVSHVVSVDIPSGLASDSAQAIGPAVSAELTVTFTAPKPANVLAPASEYSGKLIVASIGSPDELVNRSASDLFLTTPARVASWLRDSRRSGDANKGDAGKVLIVAGSRGKTGAACLAGAAAMRAGAGLVTIATPESCLPVVASQSILECMTEPLPETKSGCVSADAIDRLLELSAARDVVAIGPGLGSSKGIRKLLRQFVERRTKPLVIDADGLNALAPWNEQLRGSSELPVILTPHPGEMARLIDRSIADVLHDRVEVARRFAIEHRVTLVLKGSRTLIAWPSGTVFVNPTGNAGMASGGTGDVLTGIVAALTAQKTDDEGGAALSAVYLHGLAGDIAASKFGVRAMIASDLSANLGRAFIEAGGDQERIVR